MSDETQRKGEGYYEDREEDANKADEEVVEIIETGRQRIDGRMEDEI
jgi:hypothetical protein